MESESGSEPELARELQLRQAKAQIKSGDQRVEPYWVESGWPLAKRAVMEAESEVQLGRVPWEVAWARAEARAWAELEAKSAWHDVRLAKIYGMGGALLLGEALGVARAQAAMCLIVWQTR